MRITDKVVSGNKSDLYYDVLIESNGVSIREIFRQLVHSGRKDDIVINEKVIDEKYIKLALEYALELIGATDFNFCKKKINNVIDKREDILNRLELLKINPPESFRKNEDIKK